MTEPKTPQVEPVPGADAEAAAEAAKAAAAAKEAEATATAEAATEAEKTAAAATAAAAAAKAAAEAAAPPRTFSQEEWDKRESAKDQEISTYKTAASQAAMQAQIVQQQQTEATAKAKDQGDIEQGLITEAEAQQRQQARIAQSQRDAQMRPKMESMGRMMAAQDFGEKHGVNPYELLSDPAITTPQQMEAKAKQLAQSKSDATTKKVSDEIAELKAEIKALKEGDPLFDSGQQGAGGPDLDKLTPAELTAAAYSPREVAKRAKARNK